MKLYVNGNFRYNCFMLQLNFYPESDKKEYIKATNEYSLIWKKEGQKIVSLIEKYSDLTFKTKIINAVIFDGISYSNPMRLTSNYMYDQKEATLVHELLHRLLMDNNFSFSNKETFNKDVHGVIDLVLYDILVNLLGEDIANKNKELEISYGNSDYRDAWEWALSFSKEDRAKKFKEIKLNSKLVSFSI